MRLQQIEVDAPKSPQEQELEMSNVRLLIHSSPHHHQPPINKYQGQNIRQAGMNDVTDRQGLTFFNGIQSHGESSNIFINFNYVLYVVLQTCYLEIFEAQKELRAEFVENAKKKIFGNDFSLMS